MPELKTCLQFEDIWKLSEDFYILKIFWRHLLISEDIEYIPLYFSVLVVEDRLKTYHFNVKTNEDFLFFTFENFIWHLWSSWIFSCQDSYFFISFCYLLIWKVAWVCCATFIALLLMLMRLYSGEDETKKESKKKMPNKIFNC